MVAELLSARPTLRQPSAIPGRHLELTPSQAHSTPPFHGVDLVFPDPDVILTWFGFDRIFGIGADAFGVDES